MLRNAASQMPIEPAMRRPSIVGAIASISICLMFVFSSNFVHSATRSRTIWVSYQIQPFDESTHQLLRISNWIVALDEFGNVLKSPRLVLRQQDIKTEYDSATALRSNKDELVLFVVGGGSPSRIYRATIDKKTLAMLNLVQTQAVSGNKYLQSTARKENNFLSYGTFTGHSTQRMFRVLGRAINEQNQLHNETWFITGTLGGDRCFFVGGCSFSVSDDGRAAAYVQPIGTSDSVLFLQPLDESGRALSERSRIAFLRASAEYGLLKSVDISNIINDHRLVAYIESPEKPDKKTPDTLYVQKVNLSARPIGDRILVRQCLFLEGSQSVAIDPLGRFILYVVHFSAKDFHQNLLFQALDASGHPSGSPKFIARDTVLSGVNIAVDP